MKIYLFLFAFCLASLGYAQDTTATYRTKRIAVTDTIVLDTVSINPARFEMKDHFGKVIDTTQYTVDYKKGVVFLSESLQQTTDTLVIDYLRYPNFLTRNYFTVDPKVIVPNTGKIDRLYSLQQSNSNKTFTPFDGLNTAGSISRGITIGNNQNAVVNSELDLQITGKLSDKVSIRASIQDANIPTQEGGYSQSLDEFDQIFIELYSDNWNIRAGDVDLQNSNSYFGRFNKKVQGISLSGSVTHKSGAKTTAYAAGALVRGVFARSAFVGQEGNQGPYKLVGPNGELFILIVSGSERVYVNGLLLERGENEDYVIDYNAGELKFNATYPITENMRISVEYQYTDRNYTRFIGYGGGNYTSDKLDIGVYVYSENDAKNQPLQQNLSEEQVDILQVAGDNPDLMNAPSAVLDSYSENKILYRRAIQNGEEIYIFSTNPEDELYSVRFTLVGDQLGNYVLNSTNAINRIFEYVAPINGVPQGNYEPIIQLSAPTKLQIGGLNGSYHPSEKTRIDFEVAGSKNDLNLFSNIDDSNNNGFAGRLNVKQILLTTADTLQVKAFGSIDFLNEDFRNIERIYNIEFARDWNLTDPLGNQRFVTTGLEVSKPNVGGAQYSFQNLDYSENFKGSRHEIVSAVQLKKLQTNTNASYLDSKGATYDSKFFRLHNKTVYSLNKAWVGAKVSIENNKVKTIANDSLTPLSQSYTSYEAFTGIGDSTGVYIEAGYQHRVNDSLRNLALTKVSTSHTYYLKSKPINGKNAQLTLYANYRLLKDEYGDEADDASLNSRILYNQSLLNGGIRLNTAVETNNGVIPQQEYTYVQVEAGNGVYTWIDYNQNGIQELEEFEIAQFQDEAEYVRVLLPNQVFLKIRENKFSQIVTLNPQSWSSKEGFQKILSRFYNQTSYIIDRKIKRKDDSFEVNPFQDGGEDQLGLTLNFRNALFFNRGKQRYTTSYTYLSTSSSNLLSLGLQENKLKSHQLSFNHKLWETWLANVKGTLGSNESISDNFVARNYTLDTYEINPKLSYLLNNQTSFDVFYQFLNKRNQLGDMETLDQQKLGFSFSYTNAEKISINGEFNYIDNDFSGSAFSPVAYQILEGLQPGVNYTWRLLFQKRITKYLDANLSYFGRDSKNANTVHTGSVQLRAYF
ncbi:hypothetical protein [Ulvibacter litoralis]|uniref:Outer membrane protein beta-barrel family protein n=1 Tax=Ulvibacter litoralis TaxID=227084 RepID=A0A1G7CYY7_9FLAO|nr:hypothetical protein [Ulvibacter litoralis]SDE43695.1 hypothetical protein SAMN05421855_101613 [Ulvibacter litoralis]